VKAGGMRVSKKQENGRVEKTAKPPGKEKSRYSAGPAPLCPIVQMSHKIHAAALQVAHQKPQPTLEKFILPK
ncbi:DAL1A protein, partial [Tyrannus savana]|nr:DAL1A protein [Tyrannus savana]